MRRYETMVIVQPDLADDLREPLFERMKEVISRKEGALMEFDDWGVRQMAYEIKKKKRGHYIRLDYCGNGAIVSELERFFRIDDRILKYMTIILDEKADPETILAELAAGKPGSGEKAESGSPAASGKDEDAETETETGDDTGNNTGNNDDTGDNDTSDADETDKSDTAEDGEINGEEEK